MKTDKISFGTRPTIGCFTAELGLSKYREGLTSGILDAYEKLSKNKINDSIDIKIGVKKEGKSKYVDSLEIFYYPKYDKNVPQSSEAFNPRELEKLTVEKISELILKTYENLKTSMTQKNTLSGMLTQHHPNEKSIKCPLDKIRKLTDIFGTDDAHLKIYG